MAHHSLSDPHVIEVDVTRWPGQVPLCTSVEIALVSLLLYFRDYKCCPCAESKKN